MGLLAMSRSKKKRFCVFLVKTIREFPKIDIMIPLKDLSLFVSSPQVLKFLRYWCVLLKLP